MFKDLLSFQGRIRRTEYGLSIIISFFLRVLLGIFTLPESNSPSSARFSEENLVLIAIYLPISFFLLTQGAKRCHDLGKSGWYQLIPMYAFLLIFQEGDRGKNEYGEDPKAKNDSLQNKKTSMSGNSINKQPSYKMEVKSALQRLNEWNCDIPAIIIVATDLIYKKDYKWARDFLETGDRYNDKVFAIKCLLGLCYIHSEENNKAYDCALAMNELIDNMKVSRENVLQLNNVVGELLPRTLNELAEISELNSNKNLAQKLKILAMSLER